MTDLDTLAAASTSTSYRRPVYRSSPSTDSPLARGFLIAVGAAPVLLAVLLIATALNRAIVRKQADDAIAKMSAAFQMFEKATNPKGTP
jgi:hypothetical protein